eukprot:5513652-Alexandrium_andersonii.AAC.1
MATPSSAAETSSPPPASTSTPPRTVSPRTTQLLKEVEEIALILVAVRMAWERFACNNYPTLMKAALGLLRCKPRQLRDGGGGEEG